MPGKKKGKSGKKGKKKEGAASDPGYKKDPVAPEYLLPPPRPGEKLIKLLTTHKVNEKELHGFKVSTTALKELTPQEIKDLKEVFDVFDSQNNGFVNPPDLRRALKVLGFKVTREEARKLVRDVGTKTSGYVDFNEFLDIIIEKQGDSRDIYDEILQGFKMFDYDNTEKITVDNLRRACVDAGVKFSDSELVEMMEEADQNGDRLVDKEEFIKIMLKTNLF